MSRNKLSAEDRNDIYNLNLLKDIEKYANGENEYIIFKKISTIRSKVLRDLCFFSITKSKDVLIDFENSTKELSKIMGFSERKIYDILKAFYIVSNSMEVGFKINDNKFKEIITNGTNNR